MNDKNQRIIIRQKTIALKKKKCAMEEPVKIELFWLWCALPSWKQAMSQFHGLLCPSERKEFVRKPLQYFQGVPSELRDGPGTGVNSQPKCQPLAFTQVRVRGTRKPHQSWLTKQPKEELKRLTRAASALWLNIGSTEPSQRGDYYGARTAATLPHT